MFPFLMTGYTFVCFAQTPIKLTGEIYTIGKSPVEDAVVVLKDSLNQNSEYHVVYSDSLGRFSVDAPDKRINLMLVRCLGYKPVRIPLSADKKNLLIIMEKDGSSNLDEVVVKGVRQRTRMEHDRLVYNMETNPFKNDNAMEAFKYVPFIASDGQSFSIIGKSVTKLYVNGREKNLSSDAVNDYLKGLSADRIKSIEVIHTPNSSFRGEGNFGVINIVLKKKENEGLQGFASAQIWRTHYMKERGNFSLTYHKENLTMNLTAGVTNQSDWKKTETESFMKETSATTKENSKITGFTRSANGTFDWEYKFSDKDEMGGNINFSYVKYDWEDMGTQEQTDVAKKRLLNVRHDNDLNTTGSYTGANLFYRHLFNGKGQVLDFDFDYVYSYNKQFVWNRMDNIDDDMQYLSSYNYYKENVPQKSNVWSGKVEYRQSVGKNNFYTGIDSYYSDIDNRDTFLQGMEYEYTEDKTQSNHFALKEWTSALFAGWGRSWNSCLYTSLGGRIEYTDYTIHQYTVKEKDNNDFVRALPNLYISYRLSPDHVFSYVFSNRMERPVFSQFNPFKLYTSATSYTTGNTNLNPEIMYGQTFQYQFFQRYIFQATYQRVKHQIYELTFAGDDNIQVTAPLNTSVFEYAMFTLNTNTSYLKEYAYLNVTLSYLWQHLNNIEYKDINVRGYHNSVFQVNLNNNFTLSKRRNLSFDFNVSYNTKNISFYTETPEKFYLYGQIKKRFKSCQLSLYCFCNLYMYDGNMTTRWRNIYDTDNIRRVSLIKGEPVGFGLRFNYYFGNKKVNGTKERNTSGSEAKRRLQ